jgi:hypothetical protein
MATKKLIPEPSQRVVIWLAAVAAVALCAIFVFDYAIGDPRMSWTDSQITSKQLDFKKPNKIPITLHLKYARPSRACDENRPAVRLPGFWLRGGSPQGSGERITACLF